MKALTLTAATLNKATGTLTSDNTNVADGDTVTIGSTVYRFKDTMAAAYDVKRDPSTADGSMGNLIHAINGTGTPGGNYYAGTAAHPTVTAGALAAHAFAVTAVSVLTLGSAVATTETSAHLSWGGSTMTGGGTATLTCDVADDTFSSIVRQRCTVEQLPADNPVWSRYVEVTDEAVFIKRNGASPVGLWTEDFSVKCAVLLEPSLTWAPRITTQPTDQEEVAGADAVFAVVAVSEVTADQTYQWQSSTDNTNWSDLADGGDIAGATTATLTVTTAGDSAQYYRCVVSNTAGDTTSEVAGLQIDVAIATDPSDDSVAAPTGTSFTVAADGQPTLAFLWQISTDGGTNWSDLADAGVYTGTDTAELTISNSTGLNSRKYRCYVSNSVSNATSAAATLTVT